MNNILDVNNLGVFQNSPMECKVIFFILDVIAYSKWTKHHNHKVIITLELQICICPSNINHSNFSKFIINNCKCCMILILSLNILSKTFFRLWSLFTRYVFQFYSLQLKVSKIKGKNAY